MVHLFGQAASRDNSELLHSDPPQFPLLICIYWAADTLDVSFFYQIIQPNVPDPAIPLWRWIQNCINRNLQPCLHPAMKNRFTTVLSKSLHPARTSRIILLSETSNDQNVENGLHVLFSDWAQKLIRNVLLRSAPRTVFSTDFYRTKVFLQNRIKTLSFPF